MVRDIIFREKVILSFQLGGLSRQVLLNSKVLVAVWRFSFLFISCLKAFVCVQCVCTQDMMTVVFSFNLLTYLQPTGEYI